MFAASTTPAANASAEQSFAMLSGRIFCQTESCRPQAGRRSNGASEWSRLQSKMAGRTTLTSTTGGGMSLTSTSSSSARMAEPEVTDAWIDGWLTYVAVGSVALYFIATQGRQTYRRAQLTKRADSARRERDTKRAAVEKILTPWPPASDTSASACEMRRIVSLTANQLVQEMRSFPADNNAESSGIGQRGKKRLSCEEVMRCFCSRALAVGKDLQCTAEEPFADALLSARHADALFEEWAAAGGEAHGTALPPLHGLPVSIKDQIDMAGELSHSFQNLLPALHHLSVDKPLPSSLPHQLLLPPLLFLHIWVCDHGTRGSRQSVYQVAIVLVDSRSVVACHRLKTAFSCRSSKTPAQSPSAAPTSPR